MITIQYSRQPAFQLCHKDGPYGRPGLPRVTVSRTVPVQISYHPEAIPQIPNPIEELRRSCRSGQTSLPSLLPDCYRLSVAPSSIRAYLRTARLAHRGWRAARLSTTVAGGLACKLAPTILSCSLARSREDLLVDTKASTKSYKASDWHCRDLEHSCRAYEVALPSHRRQRAARSPFRQPPWGATRKTSTSRRSTLTTCPRRLCKMDLHTHSNHSRLSFLACLLSSRESKQSTTTIQDHHHHHRQRQAHRKVAGSVEVSHTTMRRE